MATYEVVPANVVYASKAGCIAINTTSPQSGPDSSVALQNILNQAQTSPLELVIDIPLLAQQLSVYSGTIIRGQSFGPECGVWMSIITNGTNSCIFKNAHWRSPHAGGVIVDQDIVVKDLFLNGQYANGVANNVTYPYENTNGQYISPIQFYGVKNLRIENVQVTDPASYHFHVANIQGGVFKNLYVLTPGSNGQTDGLHINGPANNILIDGLFGTTFDDFLALNAVDGNLTGTLPVGPGAFGGFGAVYYGSITNVTARNLFPINAVDICRMIVGNDPALGAGVNPALIQQIDIGPAVGIVANTIMVAQEYVGLGGFFSQINIHDMLLSSPSNSPEAVLLQNTWNDVRFANLRFYDVKGTGGLGPFTIQTTTGASSAITDLTIEDYCLTEDASENANFAAPLDFAGGTIDTINIKNCSWNRHAQTAASFCNISGGNYTRINMSDCNFKNINSAISITGGTVSGLNINGLSHRGANSNPSVSVGTGVTLPFLHASNLDTTLLAGGAGTFTSVLTDDTDRTGTPTIAAGAGAGTGPGALTATGRDTAHQVSVTTGTVAGGGVVATITYSQPFLGATPQVILVPANANAAALSGLTAVYPTNGSSSYTLTSGTTGLASSTTYLWNVFVKQ